MRVEVATEQDRERFDAAVAASPLADVLQSYEWGEIKRGSGWDALRLMAMDDSGTVRGTVSVLRKAPARGFAPILYAPRGPVVDGKDTEALAALLDAVRERAAGGFVLKCDPPVPDGSDLADALAAAGMRRVSGGAFGGVQPTAIMELDLTPGAEAVFEGFKNKWRYNVRLAERKGVTVRPGSRADLGAFYEILLETARRDGFVVRGRTYFETLFDTLKPRGMLQCFIAEYQGAPIAGILLMGMGERVIYTYGASSNEHRNVMPNHLIQWTAIRWAAEAGYKVYDFRGVSPVRDGEPVHAHIAGLNRFKEGFGARYVEYAGEFDLPLRAGWYGVWRSAVPMGMKVLRRVRGSAAAEAD